MKRLLVTLALLASFILPLHASSWTKISTKVLKSLARVEITLPQEDGSVVTGECSAFSINQKKHHYLTAAHCAGELKVNGFPASIDYLNDKLDVMVITVSGYSQKALRASVKDLRMGEEVAAYGYAYGWEAPFLKTGYISIPSASSPMFGNRPITFVTFAFIGGMSGGPVVDSSGDVVTLVNQSNRDGQAGMGLALGAILEATGTFWEAHLALPLPQGEEISGPDKDSPTQTPKCAPMDVDERGKCASF